MVKLMVMLSSSTTFTNFEKTKLIHLFICTELQKFESSYRKLKLRCTAVLGYRGSALYVTNSVNLSGLARRSPDPRGSLREGGRTPGRSNRISRSRANDRTLSRLCSRIGSFVAVANSIL